MPASGGHSQLSDCTGAATECAAMARAIWATSEKEVTGEGEFHRDVRRDEA